MLRPLLSSLWSPSFHVPAPLRVYGCLSKREIQALLESCRWTDSVAGKKTSQQRLVFLEYRAGQSPSEGIKGVREFGSCHVRVVCVVLSGIDSWQMDRAL